jgi:acetylornithine deacetylase
MMGRVLAKLDELDRALQFQPPHPLLGPASLHASIITGGQELSSYPAECRLQIERRTLPGESVAAIESELRALLDELHAHDADFRATLRAMSSRPAYAIEPEAPIARAAAAAILHVTSAAELAGMSAWTDTALLAAAGIPGVVFGPSGHGLHGAEEYVELSSVTVCAEVLRHVILGHCR